MQRMKKVESQIKTLPASLFFLCVFEISVDLGALYFAYFSCQSRHVISYTQLIL